MLKRQSKGPRVRLKQLKKRIAEGKQKRLGRKRVVVAKSV
jgi:hypothetical protein